MTVVICALPFLSRFDAVSNDARMQTRVLRQAGYESYLYSELFAPGCADESIDQATFKRLTDDPRTILVFQMCVAWAPLDAFLAQTACKVILRYQNMTPPEFFDAYDHMGAHATRAGLEQMRRIFHHPRLKMLMAGSPFTLEDALSNWGALDIPALVVAPFMTLPDGSNHVDDPVIAKEMGDGRLHLFFIGRWAPNKGHQHLVGVLNSYHEMYGSDACLTIAGAPSPNFAAYQALIMNLAKDLGLTDAVKVTGGIDERQLLTYLRHATAFLLTSEHEGFCVPVVEAQVFNLPVLALAKTAVAHTVGPSQLVFSEPNYDLFAAAAHRVRHDLSLRQALVTQGQSNAARFSVEATTARFLEAIKILE